MVIYIFFLLATFGNGFSSDLCPPPKDILPCTCDGEGVNCMEVKKLDEIKAVFSKHFPQGGVRNVWLQGTPINAVPAELFGNVFSLQFHLDENEIETVDLKAFKASEKSVVRFSFYGNKIVNFPFTDISKFENLDTLNLARNRIEFIPENAFNHDSLTTIYLAQNRIKHIGTYAFSNMKYLGLLELSTNPLTSLGPLSMAMNKHSPFLSINFANNNISEMDVSSFNGTTPQTLTLKNNKLKTLKKESFESLVTRMAQRDGSLEVSGNPFTCTGCAYSWLAINKLLLNSTLVGFICEDGRSLQDLTSSNIDCV